MGEAHRRTHFDLGRDSFSFLKGRVIKGVGNIALHHVAEDDDDTVKNTNSAV